MGTGTLVKVWKKVNSVKPVKILDSWRRTWGMLSLNKLLTKKTRKNFKRAVFGLVPSLLYPGVKVSTLCRRELRSRSNSEWVGAPLAPRVVIIVVASLCVCRVVVVFFSFRIKRTNLGLLELYVE